MSNEDPYYLVVQMNVEKDYEADFNAVYDHEHLQYMAEVPGVISITRLEALADQPGYVETADVKQPRYLALFEIDDPAVADSDAFKEARDRGRWPTEIRPRTSERSAQVYRRRTGVSR